MTTEDDILPAPLESDRSWRFDLVAPLFFRPRTTLLRVCEQTRAIWQAPILLLVLAAVAHALVAGSINAAAKAGGEIVLPPGFEYYTPEQQAQYQQAATATNTTTFNYVLPVLGAAAGVVVIWLVVGWVLHLFLTLLGGRGSSGQALNLAAFAALPFLLRALIQTVAMLLTDQLIAGPGLSGFAPAGEGVGNLLTAAVLGQIDLFLIWNAVLLVVGARLSSRLPLGRCLLAVGLTLIIVLALRALPAVILAQFSDLTVIQPIF